MNTGASESKRVFLPPDADSDPQLGLKSLVIEYQKEKLILDEEKHFNSKFCKSHRLEEPLRDLVNKLNESVSKYKRS